MIYDWIHHLTDSHFQASYGQVERQDSKLNNRPNTTFYKCVLHPSALQQSPDMAQICYRNISGTIYDTSAVGSDNPCGQPSSPSSFVPCCVPGHTCMMDGLCRYTNTSTGRSGYYVASCTDSTYDSSVCPQQCSKSASQARNNPTLMIIV